MTQTTKGRIEVLGFAVSLFMMIAGVLILAISVCATNERDGSMVAVVGLIAAILGCAGACKSMDV